MPQPPPEPAGGPSGRALAKRTKTDKVRHARVRERERERESGGGREGRESSPQGREAERRRRVASRGASLSPAGGGCARPVLSAQSSRVGATPPARERSGFTPWWTLPPRRRVTLLARSLFMPPRFWVLLLTSGFSTPFPFFRARRWRSPRTIRRTTSPTRTIGTGEWTHDSNAHNFVTRSAR